MYFHVFSIPSLFSSLGSRIMWPSSQQSLERSALLRHFALPDAAESSSRLSPILSESDQADDKAWSFLSFHAVLHLTKSMLSNKRCDKLRQNYATYKRQGHVFFQSTWHRDTLLLHHGNQPWTWPWRAMRPRVSMGPSHKSSLEHWIKPFPKNATVISVLLIQLSPRLSFIEFRREAKAKSFDLLQLPWFEEKTSASVAITLATEAPDSRAAQSFRHGKLGSAPCRDTARAPAALAKRKASRSVCRQVVESRDLVKSQEGLKPFLLED